MLVRILFPVISESLLLGSIRSTYLITPLSLDFHECVLREAVSKSVVPCCDPTLDVCRRKPDPRRNDDVAHFESKGGSKERAGLRGPESRAIAA